MIIAGLIVAAGRGTRLGTATPKQYLPIAGEPVLARAARALLASGRLSCLQVVIGPDDTESYASATAHIADPRLLPPVTGADTRSGSVRHGLEALAPSEPDLVLIHDAARPFLPAAVLDSVIEAALEHGAAFPALPVVDALWRRENGTIVPGPDRAPLLRAQTPQAFRYRDILRAHRAAAAPADDDVALARAAGISVVPVAGSEDNFKITTPEDMKRAERKLFARQETRVGNGFDVHRFAPGDHVVLCGIEIPHDRSLSGHSDADVAMHALTDAIFGALAEGDIGRWFPPSDPQWKGAASRIFLEKAVARARKRGFRIANLDCTIICEHPKIAPYAEKMLRNIAAITGIEPTAVSIKATTTEALGFTGRGEGIAAQANATLVAP
ncbi:MAG: bifunctional 2-C-methyl-D-erythritol 4-phosphate cytidylyltransferase/2-C-methyl-D-erythritol 2,4-cyclodiphosphate synthase [Paracoccaceae bacterium]